MDSRRLNSLSTSIEYSIVISILSQRLSKLSDWEYCIRGFLFATFFRCLECQQRGQTLTVFYKIGWNGIAEWKKMWLATVPT